MTPEPTPAKDESEATAQGRELAKALTHTINRAIKCALTSDTFWKIQNIIEKGVAAATQGLREELRASNTRLGLLIDKPHAARIKEFLSELAEYLGLDDGAKIPEDFIAAANKIRQDLADKTAANAARAQELADERQKFQHYSAQMVGNVATLVHRTEELEADLTIAKVFQTKECESLRTRLLALEGQNAGLVKGIGSAIRELVRVNDVKDGQPMVSHNLLINLQALIGP